MTGAKATLIDCTYADISNKDFSSFLTSKKGELNQNR